MGGVKFNPMCRTPMGEKIKNCEEGIPHPPRRKPIHKDNFVVFGHDFDELGVLQDLVDTGKNLWNKYTK